RFHIDPGAPPQIQPSRPSPRSCSGRSGYARITDSIAAATDLRSVPRTGLSGCSRVGPAIRTLPAVASRAGIGAPHGTVPREVEILTGSAKTPIGMHLSLRLSER